MYIETVRKHQIMKIVFLSLFTLFSSVNLLLGQNLISYEKVGTKSLEVMMEEYSFLIQTGVDHYRVLYKTVDIEGVPDTASGLISVPINNGFLYPVCIHQHGTVGGREDVPSNLSGGYEIGEVAAGFNMIAISPDYIGLGTSRGQHPYVHADSESWAAIDMYEALDEFLVAVEYDRNDQIFITGYSQGGHASMAVHKELETDFIGTYNVTAASHMSGPYSISEKMVEYTLSDEEYLFSAYLANTTLSMLAAYPELLQDYPLENIFKSQYIDPINQFVAEEINLFELDEMIQDLLIADVGKITPKDMLHDSILLALTTDPDHPLTQSLAKQDVYDWAPQAPTRIFYCEADEQVYYENGVLAGEVMNANGAPNVTASSLGPDLDHAGCAVPAVTSSMLFFLQFTEVISGVNDLEASANYRLRNSNVFEALELRKDVKRNIGDRYMIMNMQGVPVKKERVVSDQITHIPVDELPSGHYFLIIKETREILRFWKI